jgi:hypothetical protein
MDDTIPDNVVGGLFVPKVQILSGVNIKFKPSLI